MARNGFPSRITSVGVSVVRVRQFDRLVYGVDVLGRTEAHGRQVASLEDVERLQQDGPLVPGTGLVDVEAVEARCERLFDPAVIRGEILVREHTARRSIGR